MKREIITDIFYFILKEQENNSKVNVTDLRIKLKRQFQLEESEITNILSEIHYFCNSSFLKEVFIIKTK